MSKSDNKSVKRIYSERQVNQKGIIPLIYKENINYLMDKIEELEKRIEYLEERAENHDKQ